MITVDDKVSLAGFRADGNAGFHQSLYVAIDGAKTHAETVGDLFSLYDFFRLKVYEDSGEAVDTIHCALLFTHPISIIIDYQKTIYSAAMIPDTSSTPTAN